MKRRSPFFRTLKGVRRSDARQPILPFDERDAQLLEQHRRERAAQQAGEQK